MLRLIFTFPALSAAFLIASASLCILFSSSASASSPLSYSALCDSIVDHARAAARLHNAGQVEAALQEVDAARSVFREAVAVDDSQPQAYFNMANFLLNSQHLEESLPLWEAAAARVLPAVDHHESNPNSGGSSSSSSSSNNNNNNNRAEVEEALRLRDFFLQKRTYAQFGVHSMRRDAAYSGGSGNLTEALQHARHQLEIYPSPEVYFDMATLQTMLASVGRAEPSEAMDNFRAAQNTAYSAWVMGLASRDPRRPLDKSKVVRCLQGPQVVGDFASSSKINSEINANGSGVSMKQDANLVSYDWRRLAAQCAEKGNIQLQAALTFPAHLQPGPVSESELVYGGHDIKYFEEACSAEVDENGALKYGYRQPRQAVYIASLRDVLLWGGDGLISQFVPRDQYGSDCRLFVPSGRSYVNLPRNLQIMQSAWGMPPAGQWHDFSKGSALYFGQWPFHGLTPQSPPDAPAEAVMPRFKRAASVVQCVAICSFAYEQIVVSDLLAVPSKYACFFKLSGCAFTVVIAHLAARYAALSYYHWVLEAAGRLIVLLESGLFEHEGMSEDGMVLLLPQDSSSNKFVLQYLDILRTIYPALDAGLNHTTTGLRLVDRLAACYVAARKPEKLDGIANLVEKCVLLCTRGCKQASPLHWLLRHTSPLVFHIAQVCWP